MECVGALVYGLKEGLSVIVHSVSREVGQRGIRFHHAHKEARALLELLGLFVGQRKLVFGERDGLFFQILVCRAERERWSSCCVRNCSVLGRSSSSIHKCHVLWLYKGRSMRNHDRLLVCRVTPQVVGNHIEAEQILLRKSGKSDHLARSYSL